MAATYHRFALPYLRTNHMAMPMEEVRPSEEHRRRWMPQGNLRASRPDYGSTAAAVQQLQVSDPLYFNSLVDKSTLKHLTKPTVRKHLYQRGFMARDGAAHQTRQEQVITNRHSRFRTDQESLLVKVEAREQARLQRLRKAARAGDITFTQDGIFETKPCYACKVQHKVASISSPIEPCPGSRLMKYNLPKRLDPLPEPYRTRRSRKLASVDISTQTSSHLFKVPSQSKDAATTSKSYNISTQTSSRAPSKSQHEKTTSKSSLSVGQRSSSTVRRKASTNSSTTSGQSRLSKRDSRKGLDRTETSRSQIKSRLSVKASGKSATGTKKKTSRKISAMDNPYPLLTSLSSSEASKASGRSLATTAVGQAPSKDNMSSVSSNLTEVTSLSGHSSDYSEEFSSGTRTPNSCTSAQEQEELLQLELKRAEDEVNRRILEQEEEALRNRLELEIKLHEKALKRQKEVHVEVAMRELREKNEEDRLTLELKDKIKRNTALEIILNSVMEEMQKSAPPDYPPPWEEQKYPTKSTLGISNQCRLSASEVSQPPESMPDSHSKRSLASVKDRPPTPPVYNTPVYNSTDSLLARKLSSLKTINEDEQTDFSEEFEGPLQVSNMALVQYESLDTKLGLRKLEELGASGGSRPSLSEESVVGEQTTENCEMPQYSMEDDHPEAVEKEEVVIVIQQCSPNPSEPEFIIEVPYNSGSVSPQTSLKSATGESTSSLKSAKSESVSSLKSASGGSSTSLKERGSFITDTVDDSHTSPKGPTLKNSESSEKLDSEASQSNMETLQNDPSYVGPEQSLYHASLGSEAKGSTSPPQKDLSHALSTSELCSEEGGSSTMRSVPSQPSMKAAKEGSSSSLKERKSSNVSINKEDSTSQSSLTSVKVKSSSTLKETMSPCSSVTDTTKYSTSTAGKEAAEPSRSRSGSAKSLDEKAVLQSFSEQVQQDPSQSSLRRSSRDSLRSMKEGSTTSLREQEEVALASSASGFKSEETCASTKGELSKKDGSSVSLNQRKSSRSSMTRGNTPSQTSMKSSKEETSPFGEKEVEDLLPRREGSPSFMKQRRPSTLSLTEESVPSHTLLTSTEGDLSSSAEVADTDTAQSPMDQKASNRSLNTERSSRNLERKASQEKEASQMSMKVEKRSSTSSVKSTRKGSRSSLKEHEAVSSTHTSPAPSVTGLQSTADNTSTVVGTSSQASLKSTEEGSESTIKKRSSRSSVTEGKLSSRTSPKSAKDSSSSSLKEKASEPAQEAARLPSTKGDEPLPSVSKAGSSDSICKRSSQLSLKLEQTSSRTSVRSTGKGSMAYLQELEVAAKEQTPLGSVSELKTTASSTSVHSVAGGASSSSIKSLSRSAPSRTSLMSTKGDLSSSAGVEDTDTTHSPADKRASNNSLTTEGSSRKLERKPSQEKDEKEVSQLSMKLEKRSSTASVKSTRKDSSLSLKEHEATCKSPAPSVTGLQSTADNTSAVVGTSSQASLKSTEEGSASTLTKKRSSQSSVTEGKLSSRTSLKSAEDKSSSSLREKVSSSSISGSAQEAAKSQSVKGVVSLSSVSKAGSSKSMGKRSSQLSLKLELLPSRTSVRSTGKGSVASLEAFEVAASEQTPFGSANELRNTASSTSVKSTAGGASSLNIKSLSHSSPSRTSLTSTKGDLSPSAGVADTDTAQSPTDEKASNCSLTTEGSFRNLERKASLEKQASQVSMKVEKRSSTASVKSTRKGSRLSLKEGEAVPSTHTSPALSVTGLQSNADNTSSAVGTSSQASLKSTEEGSASTLTKKRSSRSSVTGGKHSSRTSLKSAEDGRGSSPLVEGDFTASCTGPEAGSSDSIGERSSQLALKLEQTSSRTSVRSTGKGSMASLQELEVAAREQTPLGSVSELKTAASHTSVKSAADGSSSLNKKSSSRYSVADGKAPSQTSMKAAKKGSSSSLKERKSSNVSINKEDSPSQSSLTSAKSAKSSSSLKETMSACSSVTDAMKYSASAGGKEASERSGSRSGSAKSLDEKAVLQSFAEQVQQDPSRSSLRKASRESLRSMKEGSTASLREQEEVALVSSASGFKSEETCASPKGELSKKDGSSVSLNQRKSSRSSMTRGNTPSQTSMKSSKEETSPFGEKQVDEVLPSKEGSSSSMKQRKSSRSSLMKESIPSRTSLTSTKGDSSSSARVADTDTAQSPTDEKASNRSLTTEGSSRNLERKSSQASQVSMKVEKRSSTASVKSAGKGSSLSLKEGEAVSSTHASLAPSVTGLQSMADNTSSAVGTSSQASLKPTEEGSASSLTKKRSSRSSVAEGKHSSRTSLKSAEDKSSSSLREKVSSSSIRGCAQEAAKSQSVKGVASLSSVSKAGSSKSMGKRSSQLSLKLELLPSRTSVRSTEKRSKASLQELEVTAREQTPLGSVNELNKAASGTSVKLNTSSRTSVKSAADGLPSLNKKSSSRSSVAEEKTSSQTSVKSAKGGSSSHLKKRRSTHSSDKLEQRASRVSMEFERKGSAVSLKKQDVGK